MVVRFPLFNKGVSRVVLTEMIFGRRFQRSEMVGHGDFHDETSRQGTQ